MNFVKFVKCNGTSLQFCHKLCQESSNKLANIWQISSNMWRKHFQFNLKFAHGVLNTRAKPNLFEPRTLLERSSCRSQTSSNAFRTFIRSLVHNHPKAHACDHDWRLLSIRKILLLQKLRKKCFSRNFEFGAVQKCVNLVDLEKTCKIGFETTRNEHFKVVLRYFLRFVHPVQDFGIAIY